jgi:hypothetical protein
MPAMRAMTQVSGWSNPMMSGRISAWRRAIHIPTTASIEPTDRSMLRDTMMSTIPVAMMATAEVCTERFHRLRGVRKVPPDQMWKLIQITSNAPSMPTNRVSISIERTIPPNERATGGGSSGAAPRSDGVVVVSVTRLHLAP